MGDDTRLREALAEAVGDYSRTLVMAGSKQHVAIVDAILAVLPEHRDDVLALLGMEQVGWMPKPDLANEFGVTPLDDDYLCSLEAVEHDGGMRPEFLGRVAPVFVRKSDLDG